MRECFMKHWMRLKLHGLLPLEINGYFTVFMLR